MEEFEILPDAFDAVSRLKKAGFALIVATNQPDVASGLMDRKVLAEMHQRLRNELPIDDIFVCDCLESDYGCNCYKPKPGLLLSAAHKWTLDLKQSFMVGDRWRDVGAGKAAGCWTIYIDRGYLHDKRPVQPDIVVTSLDEACNYIVNK